ncbi:Rep family protein [Bifidobacterium moukalabense]|uniref:Rep family protein n=1 Tax=Bifidobacterium moukalabense TaxID=1333651 RepID=UPI001FCE5D83|nr:Rep family protein [Bifidobacterium moukalabense]
MWDKMTQTKNINEKGRYWAGLIYPDDSCPEDWEDRMKLSGLEILVSPVHDRDIADMTTGELKKPHRHVIAMWANTTTRKNAEHFFEQFGGPRVILRLENPRGMARYLIHMDDPDKAQYSPDDVIAINGADWRKLALIDGNQSDAMAIVKLVEEKGIQGYFNLLKVCEADHPELLEFATRQVTYCREVIWSFWNTYFNLPKEHRHGNA